MRTAEKLGERRIIEIIRECLDMPPNMPVPFGDDVTAVEHHGHLAVLKTDMLVGKTDVPPLMSLKQAARKAVVMNISDFAAKGATPLALVASLGIPSNMTERDVEEVGRGLNAGAREYGIHVLGGDTNEADDLVISVALYGTARKDGLIFRSRAQPKDSVATTGLFGLASSGLKMLMENREAPEGIRKKLLDAVLMPHARLSEGLALAATGVISASIDSSDGLAWSLFEIGRASGVGFKLYVSPIAQEAYRFAEMHCLDPVELGFYGGEEYELVVTVKPEGWEKARKAVERKGGCLVKIGEATTEKGIFLEKNGRIVEIEARGYEHFKH
jgi:thiamine-monophosphate kinase